MQMALSYWIPKQAFKTWNIEDVAIIFQAVSKM